MEYRTKEMKALRQVIVLISIVTCLNPSATQIIPFTEALLYVQSLVYFHLIVQYWYNTETAIKYMQNSLPEIHCPKDVYS